MTRLVDATAGEYNTDAPSNRQEEEDHLMRAINESLTASGVQSPPTYPPVSYTHLTLPTTERV